MEPNRTRVLCVDDCADLTRALGMLINMQPDLECVGALESADDLVAEVTRHRADVVVLDIHMPGTPPLAALRELSEQAPKCRVIVHSGDSSPEGKSAAMTAGATACVSKLHDPSEMLLAIRRAVL